MGTKPGTAISVCSQLVYLHLEKLRLINEGQLSDKPNVNGEWSGKLNNPGKNIFSGLAAKAVQKVNHMKDKDGVPYARKATIRCGLSKNFNDVREEQQLFPHLQDVILKHLPELKHNVAVRNAGENINKTRFHIVILILGKEIPIFTILRACFKCKKAT